MANLSLPQDPTPEELRAQQRQDQQELASLDDDNDLPLPERDTDDLDEDDDLEGDLPVSDAVSCCTWSNCTALSLLSSTSGVAISFCTCSRRFFASSSIWAA